MNLFTSARLLAGTTVTNQNGAYRFQDLAPGNYFVNMILPPGYVFSPMDQGQSELVDSDTDPATTETLPVTLAAGENGLVFTTGIYSPTTTARPDPGTVQPPPSDIRVCAAGVYPLGGVSTISVKQLAPDYCLEAFLWSHGFAIGRIPGDSGRILSEVTFVEFFYQNTFVYKYDVPGQLDSIQVCYAVPQGRQVQIYIFDHYGPRFGQPMCVGFGSVLVARYWEEDKRAVFPYLLTQNVAHVKKRLKEMGYTLLDPMQWYLDQLPEEDRPPEKPKS